MNVPDSGVNTPDSGENVPDSGANGQSGNDARLRTGGSKIEGWNTASHVVKILI